MHRVGKAFFCAIALTAPLRVLAADLPKSGEAEFNTYATIRPIATIDSGAGKGGVWDYTGVMQNINGEGPFNNMAVRCLGNWTMLGEQMRALGSCVLTDPDGDSVFDTFEGATFNFVAGTGKYKGINGQVTITRTALHDLPGGIRATVNNHKVTWEIR